MKFYNQNKAFVFRISSIMLYIRAMKTNNWFIDSLDTLYCTLTVLDTLYFTLTCKDQNHKYKF